MSQEGYKWMFNRGYYEDTTSTVIGYENVGKDDLVCTEGGNSGEHCNVAVLNTDVTINLNDGYGYFVAIQAAQVTQGAIAVMQGDSGSPVMSLKNTQTGQVRAAGMIQSLGTTTSPCPAANQPAACSVIVFFTSMSAIVNSISGASLYTG